MAKPYMPLMMGDKFNEPAWNTEQTYSENFKKIPNSSGVYAFVTINDEVLYVSLKYLYIYIWINHIHTALQGRDEPPAGQCRMGVSMGYPNLTQKNLVPKKNNSKNF